MRVTLLRWGNRRGNAATVLPRGASTEKGVQAHRFRRLMEATLQREPWHLRLRGPLTLYVGGLRERLIELGYAPPSVYGQCRLACDLSGWMDDGGFGLEVL